MKLLKSIFVEKYIKYCKESLKAMEKGDSRTNNRYAKRLNRLEKQYENEEYYLEALNEIMDNEDLGVASFAASEFLKRNSNTEKAERVLKKVMQETSGVTAFGAEMALKIWHERTNGNEIKKR